MEWVLWHLSLNRLFAREPQQTEMCPEVWETAVGLKEALAALEMQCSVWLAACQVKSTDIGGALRRDSPMWGSQVRGVSTAQ